MEVSGFFISFFISLYSLKTVFTETNSSCQIYKLIKALDIRTSIVFSFSFPKNTLLLYFFFFFFTIDLYFLIPAVIAQFFIPIAELAIPTGTQTNETNAEIETHPAITEERIIKSLI